MYLLIGIFVSLHALCTFINWDDAEKNGDRRSIWIPVGLVFGLFGVAAYKIWLCVRRRQSGATRKAWQWRKLTRAELHEDILGTLMASPPFIGFLCFVFFPTIVSLAISLFDLHSYDLSRATFVGFSNFRKLVGPDPETGSSTVSQFVNKAFVNTLTYCLSVPLRIVVTVFIANLMAKPIRKCVSAPVRVILFLPSLCSSVGVTLMWQWILQADYGIVNTVIAFFGGKKINFMGDPNWFWFSVNLMVLWMRATNIVNMQAALANVPASAVEAAELDGASKRQVFWKITLPAVTPTLFYIVTMDLIAALQESGIMQFVTTSGVGPDFKAVTLSYYVYRMAFTTMGTDGMGLGCALAVMLAIFIIILNKLNFRLGDRWVTYDV